MSRRAPNPSAERAAQNQQTLKTLVKVEGNKSCADCKRNKHPRWASWNLGIFVCIRCSGIHRGMGTHISRVKSVDLDAWTDEQLQNMLRWGNARANKYWEAKLAPGHIPAENKIENFIRTKYDSKRWVMDGGMPDPASLDVAGDDEVPLNVVQEKAKLERSASLRTTSAPIQPPPSRKTNPDIDLFGDDLASTSNPSGPAADSIASSNPPIPSKTGSSAARQIRTGDSLLGFDFFGGTSSALPARPSSAAATMASSTTTSRPDLKQSILSLYSSTSRSSTPSHTVPQSPPSQTGTHSRQQSTTQGASLRALDDDFKGLNFSSPPAPQPATSQSATAFANLTSPGLESGRSAATLPTTSRGLGGGGGFFDAKPAKSAQAPAELPKSQRQFSASSGFGDFEAASSPLQATPITTTTSNSMGDMLDVSAPSPSAYKTPVIGVPSQTVASPFNLSARQQIPPPNTSSAQTSTIKDSSNFNNMDPWGSNEAWAASAPPSAPPPTTSTNVVAPKAPVKLSSPTEDWGWSGSGGASSAAGGSSGGQQRHAVVTTDEDFGGWESSAISPTLPTPQPKSANAPAKTSGGFASNDNDLFSNVWE